MQGETMDRTCRDCGARNLAMAQFCARCGSAIAVGPATVGRAPHPNPAPVPEGYRRCGQATDLYYRVGSAWGGSRLLGTENVGISLFNAGYPLENARLRVDGLDDSGKRLFSVEPSVEFLPQGEAVEVEIPSYEITEPAEELNVTLVSAEYQG